MVSNQSGLRIAKGKSMEKQAEVKQTFILCLPSGYSSAMISHPSTALSFELFYATNFNHE